MRTLGHDWKEIGEKLGIAPSTARNGFWQDEALALLKRRNEPNAKGIGSGGQMNWEQFKTGPGGSDLPTDVEPGESELLQAFDRWIHTAHPNPERKGCPGKSVLMALALAREKFEDEYALAHIGHCAACLDDLKQIKRELTAAGSSR